MRRLSMAMATFIQLPQIWSTGQARRWIGGLQTSPNALLLLVSLYLVLTQNSAFWLHVNHSVENLPWTQAWLIRMSVMWVQLTLCSLLLGILGLHKGSKPVLCFTLLLAPWLAYFMDRYDTVIDRAMIENILETTDGEAMELITIDLFNRWMVWGVLPSVWIARLRIQHEPAFMAIFKRLLLLGALLAVAVMVIFTNFQSLSFWGREHREVRLYVNPVFPMISAIRVAYEKLGLRTELEYQELGLDAWLAASPTTLVLVVGETARADHFGINGYARQTTPELQKFDDLVTFADVSSCGTYTALSVPCLFSRLSRSEWDKNRAENQDDLLDVLARAGVQITWIENDGGCKGICDGHRTLQVDTTANGGPCAWSGCSDLEFLPLLRRELQNQDSQQSQILVLHQFGSHGPAYHRRTPEDFKAFQPACEKDQPTLCSHQQLVNAYDNTIFVTDRLIAGAIDALRELKPGQRSALVYISDHGESLGENGVYLHGLPYAIAPDEQKKVPLIVWQSEELRSELNAPCIIATQRKAISQDHVFDLVGGLFGLQSQVYQRAMDPLSHCRDN